MQDVILRIFRQTDRDEDKKRGQKKYEQRYSLGDDCDEVFLFSFFFFLFSHSLVLLID